MIKGTAAAPGIARGTAVVLASEDYSAAPARVIEEAEVKEELRKFDAALAEADKQLAALQKKIKEKVGKKQADIFAAQALVLQDPSFLTQVSQLVSEKKTNIEAALALVIGKYAKAFAEISDPYFRERAADIRDVGRRLLSLLLKDQGAEALHFPDDAIVVAEELLPSTLAHMDYHKVRGIATERGGKTSHTAILARSLGIPAVTGLKDAAKKIKNGDLVIVDGAAGAVFPNPKPSVRQEYEKLEAEFKAYRDGLKQFVDLPSVTTDGAAVVLCANIGKQADAEAALLYKADGVGLYRTEFFFNVQSEFPGEDAQYEMARNIASKFHPHKVVFRVLDMGGDKDLPYFPLPASRNPSLALRGIRLLFKFPEILRTQLRALLRASSEFPLRIMLPMVAGVEDMIAFRKIVAEELAKDRSLRPQVEIGAMIEVPSAAMMAACLCEESDFFSLGTNDLVQYLLAADREDDSMAPYYEPLHPVVLRTISSVAQTFRAKGKDLSICGALAGDPYCTELLLGLGLRNFSVAPGQLMEIKRAVRSVSLEQAEGLARKALACVKVSEIEQLLRSTAAGRAG